MRRLLFSPRCVLRSHVNREPSSDQLSLSEGVLQQIGAPGVALSTLVSLISLNNLPWLLISDSLLTLIPLPLLGNRSAHIPRYLLQMGASNKSYSRFVCRRNHLGVPRTLLHPLNTSARFRYLAHISSPDPSRCRQLGYPSFEWRTLLYTYALLVLDQSAFCSRTAGSGVCVPLARGTSLHRPLWSPLSEASRQYRRHSGPLGARPLRVAARNRWRRTTGCAVQLCRPGGGDGEHGDGWRGQCDAGSEGGAQDAVLSAVLYGASASCNASSIRDVHQTH